MLFITIVRLEILERTESIRGNTVAISKKRLIAFFCKKIRTNQSCFKDLFSLYSQVIFRSIDKLEGVKIGGVNINSIRFADDTVLIAESEKNLQKLLDTVQKQCENFEMHMQEKQPSKIKVGMNDEMLKQVNQFKYLGSIMPSDANSMIMMIIHNRYQV